MLMTERIWYDSEEDILGAQFSDEKYWKSVELPNGVVIDFSRSGKITGLEIFKVSRFLKGELKTILSSLEKTEAKQ